MPALVIAEHDNRHLRAPTLNTVTAAAKAGGEVHVLVAGSDCRAVAEQAAKISGVAKVLHADAPQLFQTRWTLNYLAGPITRAQIPDLNRLVRAAPPAAADTLAVPV